MSGTLNLPMLVMVLCAVVYFPSTLPAAPAHIDLQLVGQPRVLQGAMADLFAYVANNALPGADDLHFTIEYAYPYGTSTLPNNVRVAGAGYGDPFSGPFDAALTALGTHSTTVTVSDGNATNSPQFAIFETTVLAHAQPWFYVQVPGQAAVLIQEPGISPEQFAATGGGESFAARSTAINDPAVPTARLDLDDIVVIGDAQVRAEFFAPDGSLQTMAEFIASFTNLVEIHEASGLSVIDDPALYFQYGRVFDIYVDTTTPGTYSKTWTFLFSDEDIPGGYGTGSVARNVTFSAVVAAVPLPAAGWLLCGALAAWFGTGSRRRRP